MYKVLKRACSAIVLPIRFFVFPRTRCRRRRGLLMVPISYNRSLKFHEIKLPSHTLSKITDV